MSQPVDAGHSGTAVMLARVGRGLTFAVYVFALVSLTILTLGFVLLLFGANPETPFAAWVYRGLQNVMAPFRGLFEPIPLNGKSVLETSILFAMIIYAAAALALHALIRWLTVRLQAMESPPQARISADR